MTTEYERHIETLRERWDAALATAGYDAAVIAAGAPALHYQDDQHTVFRPNPDFLQWLPQDDCVNAFLLVQRDSRPRLFFPAARDYWHAPPEPPAWASCALHIDTFEDPEALRSALAAAVAASGRTVLCAQHDDSNLGCAAFNDSRVLHAVHYTRAVKTPFELSALREATRRAVAGHLAAREAFHSGQSEFAINLAYLAASGHTADELPYGNIVALNHHAALLHYQHLDRQPPAEHFSFLLDAGARVHGYAADVTRTWAAAGDGIRSEFRSLIEDFDKRQQRLTAAVQPGRSFTELHEAAHREVAGALIAFDLVRGDAQDIFDLGITRSFLPHGLGHLLGLQTHDIGGHLADRTGRQQPPPGVYPALRLTRVVEPGFVFTVEPGLYFIPMLLDELRASAHAHRVNWARVDAFRCCGGIRIEDNVVVTADGCDNVTRAAFAEAGDD
ncbi:MAG: Xaa-Pro dipeptidase [Pseudomonadales bacterium]|nr:Xaa-Pro dipeptidase [Pseudomonadales bacterium]MCP5184888.1 Xaa-Pro dipeptidase [Pseudomonadales bacterium]